MPLRLRSVEGIGAKLRLAHQMQVSPTIVIGLGGSGTYTARRLKRLMEIRYGLPPLVRFLYLDCDQDAFASKPELSDVQDAEKIDLRISNPEQIFENAREGKGEFAAMGDWLPDELSVGILRSAIGAGGIRPIGRFAFFCHLRDFEDKFRSALDSVLAIEQQLRTQLGELAGRVEVDPNQLRLYIVGSLCGGTGSSLFLDVAILARHIISQRAPNATPSITGIFYLPSVFENEQHLRTNRSFFDIICANAYAGLMELEYFCNNNELQRNPFEFQYPHFGKISVKAAVYDEDFVIESFTPDGRCLLKKEEVFEMVARSLVVDIGSPVGARIRSANANIVTVLTMQPCYITQKHRFIHSLGLTSVVIPAYELAKRGSLKILSQFLQDKVLGNSIPASDLEKEVNAFLEANRLEERGERNDLLEALLTDGGAKLSYSLTRTREELEAEAGGDEVKQAQYVADWVDRELIKIRTEIVSNAQNRVMGRKVEVLKSAIEAISGKLEELTRTKGLRAAKSFIDQLIAVFETIRNELSDEIRKYETEQKPSQENIINNKIAFLRSLQGFGGRIKALGRVDEQAMDIALRTLEEYGNGEILNIAREAAIELIGSDQPVDGQPSLLKQLRTWQERVERAITKVNELVHQCVQELSHHIQTTTTGSTYTLEQWVIFPSEFDTWLEKMGIVGMGYDEGSLWQAIGSNFDEWLTRLAEEKGENLLDDMAAKLADRIAQKLQGWDILRVIEERRKTDERHRIDSILRTMVQVCQPFWSAPKHAPGGTPYQTVMAFTVPTAEENERFSETQDAVRNLAQEFGYQPETVYSGYPFALEMVVRVYGARAFYLTSTYTYRNQYEQKRQNPKTAQLLQIDKRFLNLLPTLHEHEKT